jgi:archaellum component FlaC
VVIDMTSIKDSVAIERTRLESAFGKLDAAVENLTQKIKAQIEKEAAEKIEALEKTINELKHEISTLSVEVVSQREENKRLKDLNKQAAVLIGTSISQIEKMVAA